MYVCRYNAIAWIGFISQYRKDTILGVMICREDEVDIIYFLTKRMKLLCSQRYAQTPLLSLKQARYPLELVGRSIDAIPRFKLERSVNRPRRPLLKC